MGYRAAVNNGFARNIEEVDPNVQRMEPNGKKPANGGLGPAYKGGEHTILPERADWDSAYFNELANYEPKHFGLSTVQIKPYRAAWMGDSEKRWSEAERIAKMQTARTVRNALAEWGKLWGEEPEKAAYPRYADQTWRSEKQYDVLRTIRDKRETGYYLSPLPEQPRDVTGVIDNLAEQLRPTSKNIQAAAKEIVASNPPPFASKTAPTAGNIPTPGFMTMATVSEK